MGYKISRSNCELEFSDYTSKFIKNGLTKYFDKELSENLIIAFLNANDFRFVSNKTPEYYSRYEDFYKEVVEKQPFVLNSKYKLFVETINGLDEICEIYPDPETNILYTIKKLN